MCHDSHLTRQSSQEGLLVDPSQRGLPLGTRGDDLPLYARLVSAKGSRSEQPVMSRGAGVQSPDSSSSSSCLESAARAAADTDAPGSQEACEPDAPLFPPPTLESRQPEQPVLRHRESGGKLRRRSLSHSALESASLAPSLAVPAASQPATLTSECRCWLVVDHPESVYLAYGCKQITASASRDQ